MQPINTKKPAPVPPYMHQHFPKYMFRLSADKTRHDSKLVATKADYDVSVRGGWVESPDEAGEVQEASSTSTEKAGDRLPDPQVAVLAGQIDQLNTAMLGLQEENKSLTELNDALEAENAALANKVKELSAAGTSKPAKGK
jgi:predicted RNase H-like nuclease (RuvC/YqgF family)